MKMLLAFGAGILPREYYPAFLPIPRGVMENLLLYLAQLAHALVVQPLPVAVATNTISG